MTGRFTRAAREAVVAAVAESEHRGDGHVGTEHLLLGVIARTRGGAVAEVLSAAGIDLVSARAALEAQDAAALAAVGIDVDAVVGAAGPGPGGAAAAGGGWWSRLRTHRPFTSGAKTALERTVVECADLGQRDLRPEHLLLALTVPGTGADPAGALLRRLEADPLALRGTLQRRLRAAS